MKGTSMRNYELLEADVDTEIPSFYRERKVLNSRKPFTCSECGSKLPKGTPYLKVFGVWDNESILYKICEDCESVIEVFGLSSFTYLWEDLQKNLEQFPLDSVTDLLASLTPIAKTKVVGFLKKGK